MTSKVLWNSVISTRNAKFVGLDIKTFYLVTPFEGFKCMNMPSSIFPENIAKQYDLKRNAKKGLIYLEISKAIYGLPAEGRLANLQLQNKLNPSGYYEVPHTPGLWKYLT